MANRVCLCGCGRSLAGRTPKARYFEANCRKKAFKDRQNAPTAPSDRGTVERVTVELERAGRLDTWQGAAALQLAQRIDDSTAVMGFAALVKELRATMDVALAGAVSAADPVDELRARRDRLRAG